MRAKEMTNNMASSEFEIVSHILLHRSERLSLSEVFKLRDILEVLADDREDILEQMSLSAPAMDGSD